MKTEKHGQMDTSHPSVSDRAVCQDYYLHSACFNPDTVYFPRPPASKITYPTVTKIGMLCALERCAKMEREFTLLPLGISMSTFEGA